jgi:hypothetical protein
VKLFEVNEPQLSALLVMKLSNGSLIFCCESIPVDLYNVVPTNLLAVERTHPLSAVEGLVDTLFAGHVAALQRYFVFALFAHQTQHLIFPVFVLKINVLLVARLLHCALSALATVSQFEPVF